MARIDYGEDSLFFIQLRISLLYALMRFLVFLFIACSFVLLVVILRGTQHFLLGMAWG